MLKLRRIADVIAARGCAKSTHYADIANGLWTKPVKLGHASAWPEHENDTQIAARIAGKSDDEIRALVKELEAARTADREARQ
ncbi:MAG: helix-turn-helix transcriptional regulator [Gammaproteobacteria bacterium]